MFSGILTATVVKTETGSLPEGKVKIKLEHDGTVLDVDEDDVEKVSFAGLLCPLPPHALPPGRIFKKYLS